jgi:hypothetical protein
MSPCDFSNGRKGVFCPPEDPCPQCVSMVTDPTYWSGVPGCNPPSHAHMCKCSTDPLETQLREVLPCDCDSEKQFHDPHLDGCTALLLPAVLKLIREREAALVEPGVKWDGRLGGGRWVPKKFYDDLRALLAERDKEIARLREIADYQRAPECEKLYHKPSQYHAAGTPCPVERRIVELWKELGI